MGCGLGDGFTDFADDVTRPEYSVIDAPGARVLEGRYARIRGIPGRSLYLVMDSDGPDAEVTVVWAAGNHCDAGKADEISFADQFYTSSLGVGLLSNTSSRGLGTLRLLDENCQPLAAEVTNAGFPFTVTEDEQGYWLQIGDDLAILPVGGEPPRIVAQNARWMRFHPSMTSLGYDVAEVVTADGILVVDHTGATISEFHTDGSEPEVVYPDLGPYETTMFLVDRTLYALDSESLTVQTLLEGRGVCWISPYRISFTSVLQFCDSELPVSVDPIVGTEPVELPARTLALKPGSNFGAFRYEGEPDAEMVTITTYSTETEEEPQVLFDRAVPGSERFTTSPEGMVIEAVTLEKDGSSTLRRRYDIDDSYQTLARGFLDFTRSNYFNEDRPFIDQYDGKTGRWLELTGWRNLERRVIAPGVVPDGGFAPSIVIDETYASSGLTFDGWFAYLRDYDGKTAELRVAHVPASSSLGLDIGWEKSLTKRSLPHGFRWAWQSERLTLAYLADVDEETKTGQLRLYFPDWDTIQIIADGVSDFTSLDHAVGIAYLVPKGDNQGVWMARMK